MSDYIYKFESYSGIDCVLSYKKDGSAKLEYLDAEINFELFGHAAHAFLCKNNGNNKFLFIITTVDIDEIRDHWFKTQMRFSIPINKNVFEDMVSNIDVTVIKDFEGCK